MLDQNNTYIKFVPFSQLTNWSVQYLSETQISFNPAYALVRIGDFLKRNKTGVTVEDNKTYKRVTIKIRNRGVIQRDTEIGRNIGTKRQFTVSEGQFILSKIDARNGAMGIIPNELNGAIVTQDFLSYDIDTNKLNPRYLVLISTTEEFISFCQGCSSGTTNRQRIEEVKFLNVKIPLPSLEEQNSLVKAHNDRIQKALKEEDKARDIESNIEIYLLDILGVKITKIEKINGLDFVQFKDINRWDLQYFYSESSITSKYTNVTIENCLSRFMKSEEGKSIRLETYKTPLAQYRYIGMEHIQKETGLILDPPIIFGNQIKSQTISVPEKYFIYGKLRPYLNKYWFNDTIETNIACSSEFFVFKIKDSIDSLFFKYVISSIIVQKQIDELTSGARMPRINETVFKNIIVPMPPIEIQNKTVAHISKLKKQIKLLKAQAEINRTTALTEFEQQIFR